MRLPALAIACASLLLAPRAMAAQHAERRAPPAAYDSPRGRVEVLGLRRWTLAMLRDSVRRYVAGQELHDAACMVTLRDSLGFAEASVTRHTSAAPGQPKRTYLTIRVVEPDQAARVRWDTRPRSEFSALLPGYAPIALPLTDSAGGLARGRLLFWLQFPDGPAREAAVREAPAAARADGALVAEFLAARRSEPERARAMRTLARDGHWVNRMVAAAVLSGFAAHDSTWLALARALRDPHEGVREAAGMALRGLPARPVDWRPAAADLRLLLNGTNLPAITEVFALLARTDVTPDLAPTLLRDNADWILDHLGAETPGARDAAHRLLRRLAGGRDHGADRAAWAAWIATL